MAETNVDNNSNNTYEVDNSSDKSKDYASSNSSYVDDAKKRNSLISFEDNKDKEDEKNKSKRSKRNSFIKRFNNKKDDDVKEGKEGKEGGLVRSLSGLFSKDKDKDKDKDNKRNGSGRTSYIFLSDDEGLEFDTSRKRRGKSRQTSNAEGLDKDNSTKQKNRLSANINKLLGLEDNKSSPKQNEWEDNFLEPEETIISPRSPRNSFIAGPPSFLNRQSNVEYVESPRDIHSIQTNNKPFPRDKSQENSIDESPIEVQSTSSSTIPSSIDDQYNQNDNNDNHSDNYHKTDQGPSLISSGTVDDDYNKNEGNGSPISPMTPNTPRLFLTRPDSNLTSELNNYSDRVEPRKVQIQQSRKDDNEIKGEQIANSIVESKPHEVKKRNIGNLVISTNNLDDVKERKINDTTTKNIADDNNNTETINNDTVTIIKNTVDNNNDTITKNTVDEQVMKKLQELENANAQLEAKVAEQNNEINKFNSMEQIMQQQIDLSKRMTETMHRFDSSDVSKVFEDTIQRLEDKIDQQKVELNQLKSIVGQLTGNQQYLLTNGNFHHLSIIQGEDQNMIIRHGEENQSLIQTDQLKSHSHSKNTLVSTLVVNPLCNTITLSATIATSVFYGVYVRPIVGLIGLVSVARDAINSKNEM